jgi:hypothetical protein
MSESKKPLRDVEQSHSSQQCAIDAQKGRRGFAADATQS